MRDKEYIYERSASDPWVAYEDAAPELQRLYDKAKQHIYHSDLPELKKLLKKAPADLLRVGTPSAPSIYKEGYPTLHMEPRDHPPTDNGNEPLFQYLVCNFSNPISESHNPAIQKYQKSSLQEEIALMMLEKAPWMVRSPSTLKQEYSKGHYFHNDWRMGVLAEALSQKMDAVAIRMAELGTPPIDSFIHTLMHNTPRIHNPEFLTYAAGKSPHLLIAADDVERRSEWWKHIRDKTITRLKEDGASFPSERLRYYLTHAILGMPHIPDMIQSFHDHVLAPAIHLAREEVAPDSGPTLNMESANYYLVKFLVKNKLEQGLKAGEIIEQFEQLSRTWHHPEINFSATGFENPQGLMLPTDIPAERKEVRWHALFDKPFTASNGLVVHCLRNEEELEIEGSKGKLAHCVHDYTYACLSGKKHIASIRTPEGEPLSTAELSLEEKKDGGHKITIVQHYGKRNAEIPKGDPRRKALRELLNAMDAGEVGINTSRLGETADSAKRDILPIVKQCGYPPTWNNIDRALQQFKLDIRRGSIGTDPANNDRLIYADHTTRDGYTHKVHLIDGYVKDSHGKEHSLRNMNTRELLTATELGDKLLESAIHSKESFFKFDPDHITATLPPPPKPMPLHKVHEAYREDATRNQSKQGEAARERFARDHGLNYTRPQR